ncbi:MAG: dihydroorotate dehydrogenase 2 [Nanoarchaeota archaeon]
MLQDISHDLLLRLDPETAHKFGKFGMKHGFFSLGRFRTEESKTKLFEVEIDNPIGLAAGFDKNGELVDCVRKYGFGFIEVGSVTYKGSKGNPKPRLFRLDGGNLLNRMGLNGDPATDVINRVSHSKSPFALNITKTNDSSLKGDKAIEDIKNTYNLAYAFLRNNNNLAYIVLNLSCPNTEDGKTFEDDPNSLSDLLSAIREVGYFSPVLIKLSPNLPSKKLEKIVEVADNSVSGYEVVNTLGITHDKYGKGGKSGPELKEYALDGVKEIVKLTKKPIIAVGGISTGEDAYNLMEASNGQAKAFLAYTGFVYKHRNNPYAGPRFAHQVNSEFLELKRIHEN